MIVSNDAIRDGLRIGEGKPGPGRPLGSHNKSTLALKDYASNYTKEAIDGLRRLAKHKKTPPAAKVAAWRELLDRGHGRPRQDMEHTFKRHLEDILAEANAGQQVAS